MADIPHASRESNFYEEYKKDLARDFSRHVSHLTAAPVANAFQQAGMTGTAGVVRSAAGTPEAGLLAQIARNTSFLQNRMGGDVFSGFERMQNNSAAFFQAPQSVLMSHSPQQNQMAAMRRSAAISAEITAMAHTDPFGRFDKATINERFTRGLGVDEMMDLSSYLAHGGAQATLGTGKDARIVSMSDPATGARDAALLTSKYAKTVRAMMDFFGSRDLQEALRDFEAITGNSLAMKGDPGYLRERIQAIGGMGMSHGLGGRAALQDYTMIRQGLSNDFGLFTPAGRTLFGGERLTGHIGSRIQAEGYMRAQAEGAIHDPAKREAILRQQKDFNQTINRTDGARAAQVLSLMEAQGRLDPEIIDEARLAYAAGDMTTFTKLVQDVSTQNYGEADYIQNMIMDDRQFGKHFQMEIATMDEDQIRKYSKINDQYKTTAYNAQQSQLREQTKVDLKYDRRKRWLQQYGVQDTGEGAQDPELAARTAASNIEEKIAELRKKPDANSQAQADKLQVSLSRFRRNMAEHGSGQAMQMLETTGTDAMVYNEVRGMQASALLGDLIGSEAWEMGMRADDVTEISKNIMTPEQQAHLKTLKDTDERAKYAKGVLEANKKKNTDAGAESRVMLKRLAQQAKTDRDPLVQQGTVTLPDGTKKQIMLDYEKKTLLDQEGFGPDAVVPALYRDIAVQTGTYEKSLAKETRVQELYAAYYEDLKRQQENQGFEMDEEGNVVKKTRSGGRNNPRTSTEVVMTSKQLKMKAREKAIKRYAYEESGLKDKESQVGFSSLQITGSVTVTQNKRTGEIEFIQFEDAEGKGE